MYRSFALLGVFAAFGCAADISEAAASSTLLGNVRSRMADILRTQPNYTCVQEIERASRRNTRAHFDIIDTLRLEVALVDGKEMFAWPGSRKFDEIDLREMVAHGAIGNGNFALHARAVFTGSAPAFRFVGEDSVRDRRAVRFDYRVPLALSGYHLRVNDTEAVVGFHGSIWADPDSLDVLRLDVVADDIPPALGLTGARDSMEYARMKIGEGNFLLPSASELRLIDSTGSESRNRTRFAGCRQYSGDSVISFAEPQQDPAEPAAAVEPSAEPQPVPAQLVSEVELQEDIDSKKSAVGDMITATLSQPLKVKKRVIVPKGASLQGRISRLEHQSGHVMLELRFTEAIAGASHWKLLARIHELAVPPGLRSFERVETSLFSKSAPQIGTLYIRGNAVRLPRGVRFTVRTEDVPAGGSQ